MRKKVMAVLVAASMVLSLTACGGSGDSSSNNTEGKTETEAAGGENELTVWCWDPAFNMYAMEEAEKEYQKENPDFKLNIVETPWADVQTKLTTAASS